MGAVFTPDLRPLGISIESACATPLRTHPRRKREGSESDPSRIDVRDYSVNGPTSHSEATVNPAARRARRLASS